jgi:hypothetical protein
MQTINPLSEFGYHPTDFATARHVALSVALRKSGENWVRLQLKYQLRTATDPKVSRALELDLQWVREVSG